MVRTRASTIVSGAPLAVSLPRVTLTGEEVTMRTLQVDRYDGVPPEPRRTQEPPYGAR